jgi:hypothetical protein
MIFWKEKLEENFLLGFEFDFQNYLRGLGFGLLVEFCSFASNAITYEKVKERQWSLL